MPPRGPGLPVFRWNVNAKQRRVARRKNWMRLPKGEVRIVEPFILIGDRIVAECFTPDGLAATLVQLRKCGARC